MSDFAQKRVNISAIEAQNTEKHAYKMGLLLYIKIKTSFIFLYITNNPEM